MGSLGKDKALIIINSRISAQKEGGKKKEYTLTVEAKDLPPGTSKRDLVAAVMVNAEREDEKKEKPKFKAKYLIPIVLPIVLLASFKGCTEGRTYVDVQNIQGVHYAVESPYMYTESVVNASGQEGKTANVLDGQESMDGEYYNAEQHFEDEQRASLGQADFEQMEQVIEENMEILISPDASQAEKQKAAKEILAVNEKIESIYKENEDFIQDEAEDFKEASMAFEDSNTEEEIRVIKETVEEYKENLGLTESNIQIIRQIVELGNDGYTITVTGEEDQRGDYTISGEAIKKFAKKSEFKEAQEKYKKFRDNMQKTQDERGIK